MQTEHKTHPFHYNLIVCALADEKTTPKNAKSDAENIAAFLRTRSKDSDPTVLLASTDVTLAKIDQAIDKFFTSAAEYLRLVILGRGGRSGMYFTSDGLSFDIVNKVLVRQSKMTKTSLTVIANFDHCDDVMNVAQKRDCIPLLTLQVTAHGEGYNEGFIGAWIRANTATEQRTIGNSSLFCSASLSCWDCFRPRQSAAVVLCAPAIIRCVCSWLVFTRFLAVLSFSCAHSSTPRVDCPVTSAFRHDHEHSSALHEL